MLLSAENEENAQTDHAARKVAELAVPSFESFDIQFESPDSQPAEQEADAAAAVCSRLHLALACARSLSLHVLYSAIA